MKINDSSVTLPFNGIGNSFQRNGDISETVGPVKDINSTFSLETAKKNEFSMEIAEFTKEGGYEKADPKIVDKYSSSIIAYTDTCTGSYMPAMDRTAKEKYDPNDNKDGNSKL